VVQGHRRGASGMSTMRVWTFVVRGGPDIALQLTGSPPLRHLKGSTTVWKMVGTEVQADAATALLRAQGCILERYSETETPEQRVERRRLLGLEEDDD